MGRSSGINWPGANNTHQANMSVITNKNQLLNNTVPGDWGWYRILNKATAKIFKHKILILHFEVEGHLAKYLLFPRGGLNPFISLNLQNFHLPQQISIRDLEGPTSS